MKTEKERDNERDNTDIEYRPPDMDVLHHGKTKSHGQSIYAGGDRKQHHSS